MKIKKLKLGDNALMFPVFVFSLVPTVWVIAFIWHFIPAGVWWLIPAILTLMVAAPGLVTIFMACTLFILSIFGIIEND
jgi:hypothetical protein